MNKYVVIVLLIFTVLIVGIFIFFYAATDTKKPVPVEFQAPVSKPNLAPSRSNQNFTTVTVKPVDDELLGLYKPDATTIKKFSRYNIKDTSTFLLNKGGLLEYRQIPISILNFTEERKNNNTRLNGSGEWRVTDKGYIELQLSFKLDENNTLNTDMVLSKQFDKYIIYYYLGDPNKDSVAVFIQQ
jgi:hypothetical protein